MNRPDSSCRLHGVVALGVKLRRVWADPRRMRDLDLLKLDDLMFDGAKLCALFIAVVGALALLLPQEVRGSNMLVFGGIGFAALAPLAMTLVGLDLRKRERRAVALMQLVDRQVELSAADLVRNSEFTNETLETAVRDLNSSGVRHVVWDRREGLIQHGNLRQSRLHIETCSSCGSKISMDVLLHEAASARCSSCDAALDAREVDEEKQVVMAEISRRADVVEKPKPVGTHFHVSLFLILLVVCWPFALVYVLKCWKPPICETAI